MVALALVALALVVGQLAPAPGVTPTAEAAPTGCPCSVFPASTPSPVTQGSGAAVELGMKFRTSVAGTVTGVRFYKSGATTGTHLGRLYTSSGTRLAEASFTNETASGWQQVSFSSPVQVSANTTYVVSFYAPDGRYSATLDYFASQRVSGPLTALANGVDGGNGVYRYAAGGGFPNSTFRAANYWVDVVFDHPDTSPPAVTSRVPAPDATGVATTTAVSATFDEAVTGAVWQLVPQGGQPVTGTTAWDAGARVSRFTPSQPLAAGTRYTATLSGAKDAAGNTMTTATWSFTTAAPDTTAPTVTGFSPANNATGVTVTSPLTATFSEPVSAATIGWSLRGPSGSPVAGTAAYDAATRTARFTPTSALTPQTAYSVTLSGAADLAGNVMAPVSWGFTTGEATAVATIWPASAAPGSAVGSSAAVELGVKFRADRDGVVTGVRFYKASANTGTHVGRLWSRTGTKLAEATFTNESGSGWQQVT
ncbi:MAG TPA: DUF4082 domain-containing protein, partial [Jiangellales bacterium]|nr:DUF4082 domain-containing protein [Jiangellales bacterium]